jgi:hypothetical protein
MNWVAPSVENAMNDVTDKSTHGSPRRGLTETLETKLANPETSPEFDLHKAVEDTCP